MTEQAQQLSETPLADFEQTTLRQWNWGAFAFTWVWALGMRLWMWGLAIIAINAAIYGLHLYVSFVVPLLRGAAPPIPIDPRSLEWLAVFVNVAAALWLGVSGNRLAWKSRKWDDLLHFRITQMAWEKYGRPLAIAVLTIVPMYFLFSTFSVLPGGEGGGHQH